uniref:NADH-ubiquinone oxidoreductase chain 4 n=1 Tax=Rhynchium quinquecinctum TaxID=1508445 RepID=A0A6M9ATZ6_9HYME|nr:NADH dehydrogenase subunit 4 [Rhynchium quinquecinctum]
MKFLLFMVFSFGLMNFSFGNLYMICFLLMFFLILNVNLIFNFWVEIYSIFSIDFYSFYLILLSIWLIGIMLMIKMDKMMIILIMCLLVILFLSFSVFNFLLFYFLFEVSLIPIFLMIMFDGYTFERIEAVMYMFFFTLISSMPFLIILLDFYQFFNTLMFYMLEYLKFKMWKVSFIIMMLVFFVKLPLFIFHIWLPKAHVEAPVYGSMILAGVLLKLGGYGMLRMVQFFYLNLMEIMMYYISIGLISGVVLSFLCMIQIDMKMLVAYSSVVHMSMLVASLSTMSKIGFVGSYLMMIGHGLCSSGLFYLVNLSYKRIGSRLMFMNKGLMNLNSTLGMWWFLMCMGNFSAPISLSLLGEIFMLMSLVSLDLFLMIYLMIMCFLSVAYSLYLFSFTQHGNMNFMNFSFLSISVKEFIIIFIHWFPLNTLIFGMNLFMI